MTEKVPPYNGEAEAAVLGSMLFDEEGLSYGVTELSKDMFYRADNSIIFRAMNSLFVKGLPVDFTTLSEKLKEAQVYEKVGGAGRLVEIARSVYTSGKVKHYGDIVKEHYNRRLTIKYAQELLKAAYEGGFDELTRKLGDIPNFEQAVKDKSTGVLMQEAVTRVEERYNEPEKNRIGLLTGLSVLDKQVGGLRAEDVIFLTAEPNVGKSLLALQVCLRTALSGMCTAYFNFEMNEEYIGDRILTMSLHIDVRAVHTPSVFLTQEEYERIQTTNIDKKLDDTLFIYTNAPPTLQTIISKCRQLRVKGKAPALIAVDYLQLMHADGISPMERVENISKGLKAIAKEFRCPVIVISSLSKDEKMRHSYQLHFDADVVMFMRTDKRSEKDSLNSEVKHVNVEIHKNRKGRVGGVVELALVYKHLKFGSADKQNENRDKGQASKV